MNITHGNILAVFFSAGPAEIEEGLSWYSNANLIARRIAERLEGNVEKAAGIIAALSPNNRWERNVRDAENLVKVFACGGEPSEIKVSTFNKNKEKALAILSGQHPESVLSGKKVRAFYHCIAGHEDVCVDGHAYAIWLGQRVPTSKTPKISPTLYDKIAEDYRKATQQINTIINAETSGSWYRPSQVQAITWVTWRKLINGELE